ncbi:glutathione hydrolase 5 proenzyme [Pelobates fuscus]|uniref:glutathione hydrolase 5 proenzyme n=1 Tax=Pelobates fuscus TaxID=191477 RepID=UPI002FE4D434
MAVSRALWVFFSILLLSLVVAVTFTVIHVLRQQKSCSGGFRHGTVAADSRVCSNIGRDILKQGGSPVDSAIAALLCTSVINPQSMGLGGGVIFTIYNASTGQVEVINARERVPSRLTPGFMEPCKIPYPVRPGVQWIGVPGEIRGYEEAHRTYGRLPWKSLFEPTIQLITEGVKVSSVLHRFLSFSIIKPKIQESSLCQLFCKGTEVLEINDTVNYTQLAHTLRILADEGADSFYQGKVAQGMLRDLWDQGSNLTLDDFRNYKVDRTKALVMPLGDYTLYSAPPPAGGAVLSFILNILQGYNFSAHSMKDVNAKTETYHKIAEALKFANGQKARLALSQTQNNVKQITTSLLSPSFAQDIRRRIDLSGNHTLSYYDVSTPQGETYGTSHVSVIGQDGSSVSVTSSINHVFGSLVYSAKTGIIFNNQLADFCSTYPRNQDPLQGEQPPSSMSPSILLSRDKKSQLVIGGSGGSMIIAATALSIMNKLWFGNNLSEAIAAPILHVKADNALVFESSFDPIVKTNLNEKGHKVVEYLYFMNVVQGASQEGECLFGQSDLRKSGSAAGY